MRKSKLKPCPFSGSKKVKIVDNDNSYQVTCNGCFSEHFIGYANKDLLTRDWNERVED